VTSRRSRQRRWMAPLAGIVLAALMPVAALAQGSDSVRVSWTASGDDGRVGTATAYDLRVSEAPITAANFGAATPVVDLPAPLSSGTHQEVMVRGLTRGVTYYFAIRSADDVGNWSPISNVLQWNWNLDAAPPAAPEGIAARRDGDAVRVNWTPNGEPDLQGYRIYRGTAVSGPFALLNEELVTATEFLDGSVPAHAAQLWYRVTALDGTGNESAPSSAVTVMLESPSATALGLEPGYPNPSRSGDPINIPIQVPADAPSRGVIEVCDGAGRRVRVLDVAFVPGLREITWDGKNDAGREVAPGVYRACLIAGKTRSTIRLVRQP